MSIHRLERLAGEAEARLPVAVARYFRQGSGASVSTAEAVTAWERQRLLPHALVDVSQVETGTTLLGTPVRTPIAVAPSTFQRAADPQGERAMAAAVAELGSLLTVSSNAGTRFEAIAETGVAWWLQAYLPSDRHAALPLLERAVEAGARAIVLTADTPVVANKDDGDAETIWQIAEDDWLQVNFDANYGSRPEHAKARDLGPADIEWLRERTGLPVVVKGILRPDDAARCVAAGAAAIWVSNHGGRQLDGAAATADCLPDVVAAVGDQAEVYVDGGIRSGRHVLTALALGARGVFLGRPPLWALAAGGRDRVVTEMTVLNDELVEAMQLAGMSRPRADPSLVMTARR
ncbi:alpha-hydroxy acid oxidase [Salinisphaera hydrothermalis]|uniref:FMN-dependent alpha-hydroxy acid dehydrogenase n=1 Tax=Salinisphaera hydrothermalis (strain C41B8) TaxID=1304275 RepID=A0A084IIA2_SALHC|nr:alpha-hydroxy acid oxidase [Salinisphaera hydrothermalis]KEZ76436.1 FMN-dependent alpha-hydroxy acid dehydrogenase [Salinisphaera hydrothermalis C41B8]